MAGQIRPAGVNSRRARQFGDLKTAYINTDTITIGNSSAHPGDVIYMIEAWIAAV